MKRLILLLTLLIAMGFLLSAGCTTPSPVTPTATPTPTITQVTSPGTSMTTTPKTLPTSGLGTPGPTQTLPPQYSMDFQINTNGDTANPMMQVSIRGGNGMNLDSQVDVTLTTLEGNVSTKSMFPPFSTGQSVTFPCSQYQNRVEIWVTAPQVGKIKVDDEIVPFKQLNP